MKKKKMNISRKLIFSKATIAALSVEQQAELVGGAVATRPIICNPSRIESCATIPPGGHLCQLCP
ncbi:class I lanthipeptide [Chitinophaga solisilvae]|uniref:Class I lanthipeptide n=1 Tax=Chitinophaga solisilvae TaxID=1233460 RepID=A0A9Q5DAW6_9BACT|nr:class I lanthipeptide [Chitinophaga solisilvae]NSL90914.1 hypothetical protein [Chitinophaga solisilvae]